MKRISPIEKALAAAEAEKTANAITTNRVIAWHGACMAELIATHGLDETEASQRAMDLFGEHNGVKPYLDWKNADTVAKEWKP